MTDRLDDLERRVTALEEQLGAGSMLERENLDAAVVADRSGFCSKTPGCILLAEHSPDCWDGVEPARVMEVPPGVILPPHLRGRFAKEYAQDDKHADV